MATVVIAAASALAVTQLTRGETDRQASAPMERRVVFVAGLQTSSDCDDPPTDGNGTSWGGLWQAIASGLGLEPDDLFVYSYSGDYECDGAPP
ncbi:MAG TPA: hypothetical protein VNL92_05185, partial [Dehalococcoidia bacterium]|nr:hypothetical protein [Dehalococcoidia bacterium]